MLSIYESGKRRRIRYSMRSFAVGSFAMIHPA
jgi:hypothetical protein